MQPHEIPIYITTASITLLAGRAVMADRFRNPITDMGVIVGGIMPWIAVAVKYDCLPGSEYFFRADFLLVSGVFGNVPLFFGAIWRYCQGPRFDHWEKAASAMVTALFATAGQWIALTPHGGGP